MINISQKTVNSALSELFGDIKRDNKEESTKELHKKIKNISKENPSIYGAMVEYCDIITSNITPRYGEK